MSVRLVVFDLDGTLVDSLEDLTESVNEVLVSCGGRPHTQDAVGRMVGDGASVLVARAFEAAAVTPPSDALARFLAVYNARPVRFTRPYAGIPETLETLSKRLTVAVLTNKPLGATRGILDALGLARFFAPSRVLGGDGPLPRKPDPAGLLHLAREAAVPIGETMMVGDSLVDWQTARAAGATACMAGYGFGFRGFPVADLDARDTVIAHPGELLDRA